MKVLDCSVKGGVATVTDSLGKKIPVPDAVLLCAGVFESSGKLVISESGAFYVTDTQPDLQFLINEVVKIADQVSELSKVAVSRSPDTAPLSPTVTAAIEQIKAALEAKELI